MRNFDELITLAAKYSFKASVIPTSEFVFRPEYRKYCEDNLCGNYGSNYSCPPHCGTPEEMKEKTTAYQHALVLQTCNQGINALDATVIKGLKKVHNQNTKKLLQELKVDCSDLQTIMAGPCGVCDVCKMPLNQPCPLDYKIYSCLSAYCIDVGTLAEKAKMDISWDLTQASFFSIILF